MNTRRRISFAYSLLSVVGVLLSSTPSIGQPAPDPSLWNSCINPSGQRAVPVVFYDATTGIVGVDTRGINRLDDTPDYTTAPGPIGFDDVGLIVLTVRTQVTGGTFFPPFSGLDLVQFIFWDPIYDSSRYRIIGTPLGNQFLWPGVYPVIQLPTNLTANAFGEIEIAVSYGAQVACVLRSNGLQIVPEPGIDWFCIGTLPCLIFHATRCVQWSRRSTRT